MTAERLRELGARWRTIEQELSDLAELKVLPHVQDPVAREGDLLLEQDAIEYELMLDHFETRDTDKA